MDGGREGDPLKLLAHGCAALFSISQEEILDRSKADIASKTITHFKTSWFALQVISRAAQHLAISTLEIFTLGIVACSLVSIFLWWHKPKDVSTQCVIRIHLTNEELEQVLAGPTPSRTSAGASTGGVYLLTQLQLLQHHPFQQAFRFWLGTSLLQPALSISYGIYFQ